MAKSLGILTGGGDCPGLNAVIRAVVRRADAAGWDVVAVREGWRGLVEPISASTEAGRAYARRRSGSGGPATSVTFGMSHGGKVMGMR